MIPKLIVYNEIKCVEDCEKLQYDLHRIFQWTVREVATSVKSAQM